MEMLNIAERLLETEKYQEALEYFQEILNGDPNNALAHQGIAQCKYYLSEYEEAMEKSKRAIELNPKLAIPHTILALTYGRKRDLERSYDEALTAIELEPNIFETVYCYGTVLLAQKRYVEAATYLQKAIQFRPGSRKTHQNLAITYEMAGDTNKCLAETRTVFRIKPSVANGIRLFWAIQRKYAFLISLLIAGLLLIILAFRLKALLLIPALYTIWGGSVFIRFALERNWRRAFSFLTLTALYSGSLIAIYSMVAQ